jgi:hypothetical protein
MSILGYLGREEDCVLCKIERDKAGNMRINYRGGTIFVSRNGRVNFNYGKSSEPEDYTQIFKLSAATEAIYNNRYSDRGDKR